jgi:hypothetical protein
MSLQGLLEGYLYFFYPVFTHQYEIQNAYSGFLFCKVVYTMYDVTYLAEWMNYIKCSDAKAPLCNSVFNQQRVFE